MDLFVRRNRSRRCCLVLTIGPNLSASRWSRRRKFDGVINATTNLGDQITRITEKLQLLSTDANVAALGYFHSFFQKPSRRSESISASGDPTGSHTVESSALFACRIPSRMSLAFCVMIGHSFGLASAIYNDNRRSAAINEI